MRESVAWMVGRFKEKGMLRLSILLFLLLGGSLLPGRDFKVMVYNVENLFDLDGVALYEQYGQGPEGDYGVEPFLRKLEGIYRILSSVNRGRGPEVVLFQEFELDRTPYRTPETEAFLKRHRGRPLETLLQEEPRLRRLPAELLLLKYLDDRDLGGYHVAQPDPDRMETHPPHQNVLFSRFPVTFVRQRPSLQARDLLVAGLDVHGHELIVFNNHWKSGASSAATEPVRVQNARVVRAELEAILLENPQADILIGGDLNAYYNHKAVFPELRETAVNDVLRANGYETRMIEPGTDNLYNLWFELDPRERGSEVWRGHWGTLMQMVLTPGLYDRRGIQYIDNSFERVILPGENTGTRWGRPLSWTNHGGGAGYSDHLPIMASFRVIPGDGSEGWMELDDPTHEALDAFRPAVPYARLDRRTVPPLDHLAALPESGQAARMGELFLIETRVAGVDPVRLRVGELDLSVYSPVHSVRERLETLRPGDPLRAYADLSDWRGRLQMVIRHPDWLLDPPAD